MERAQASVYPRSWERSLEEFSDAIPLLAWVVGSDGALMHVNEYINNYAGRMTDAKGRFTWAHLIDPKDLETSIASWKNTINSSKLYEIRHRFKMADGSSQWHLTRAVPKADRSTGAVYWYVTATNIHSLAHEVAAPEFQSHGEESEVKAQDVDARAISNGHPAISAEKFLEEFATKFSSYDGGHEFFDQLVAFLSEVTGLDYILVGRVGTDSHGKSVINTMALSVLGKASDNITYPMWKGPCYEVVRGTVYSYPSKCRHIFPENETLAELDVEGYLGYPLCEMSGKPIGVIAAMHRKEIKDHERITSILRIAAKRVEFELDRMEFEKALQKRNVELQLTTDRLQSTLDGVPAMIALLDVVHDENDRAVDFVISAANQAASEFTALDANELLGKKMMALYPEAWIKLVHHYLDVFATGKPVQLEFYNDHLKRWFMISVTRQRNGSGLVSFVLDITVQKKAEEEKEQHLLLTELDRAKTEFFSNVSHEFRTPLTLLLGPIEDVLSKGCIPGPERSRLEMAHRNALRLQKLVNSLLDFSRMESGRFDTVFQPADVGELTAQLAASFGSAIRRAGLKFIIRCDAGHRLYVNRNMWEKIVLNLLSNAFKFTFEGVIEIRIKSVKRHVQLHVRDTGIGISQENLRKIFLRFVRIENAKARAYEGSGIGLALVKELVERHSGSIKVKSKSGYGTQFTVSIPKGKAHLPAHMVHELGDTPGLTSLSASFIGEADNWLPGTTAFPATESTKPAVLLVDDNLDMRSYLRSLLNAHFTIIEAVNGRQAIELLDKGLKPAVVLSDIMMPEMNGMEFLHALKTNASTTDIPFVFVSAKASEQERIQGLQAGADYYLIKPFSANELLAVIRSKASKRKSSPSVEAVASMHTC